MSLGYTKKLFILAFDHRGSFQKKMFGIPGEPTGEEAARITDAKSVIFDGFVHALAAGAPKDSAGILLDEQFCGDLARRAIGEGIITAMPTEVSGIDEFDFDYGDEFGKHIEEFNPSFSKVLVRYNPEGDAGANSRSLERLNRLSVWLRANDRKFLCELLVPGEPAQLAAVGGDADLYDRGVRPGLMLGAIKAFQDADVEADMWKIEGIDKTEDCEMIAAQVRTGGRHDVGCVVLGRGANSEKVDHWLRTGAAVDGYRGFAIGRTIWWDQLSGYLDGSLTRRDAAAAISANYLRSIAVYESACTA